MAVFLAPHTHELKDVPRCGALNLLQKSPPKGGFSRNRCWAKKKFRAFDVVVVVVVVVV
jgi:hypothetical protein